MNDDPLGENANENPKRNHRIQIIDAENIVHNITESLCFVRVIPL